MSLVGLFNTCIVQMAEIVVAGGGRRKREETGDDVVAMDQSRPIMTLFRTFERDLTAKVPECCCCRVVVVSQEPM